jgi:hypothetical protein
MVGCRPSASASVSGILSARVDLCRTPRGLFGRVPVENKRSRSDSDPGVKKPFSVRHGLELGATTCSSSGWFSSTFADMLLPELDVTSRTPGNAFGGRVPGSIKFLSNMVYHFARLTTRHQTRLQYYLSIPEKKDLIVADTGNVYTKNHFVRHAIMKDILTNIWKIEGGTEKREIKMKYGDHTRGRRNKTL